MGRAKTADQSLAGDDPGALRLLMVEDSEDDYMLTRGFLESVRSGSYDIDWASTYEEGLQRLSAGHYDLCLLDYRLGDRTGLQLLDAARKNSIDLPFVMLTNEKDAELDGRALQLGAADFLSKLQIDPELLHRSVRFAVHHHRMMADLKQREERVTRAALAARDGIWEWNLETDMLYLSEQWREWIEDIEPAPKETPSRRWIEHVHPDDRPEFQSRLEAHLDGREETFQFEYRMRCPLGEWRWMHVRGLANTRNERRMTGFQSEITERKLLELRLERDAHHDPLTGLANRKVFLQRVNAVLSREGMARRCALLYIDLDDFKLVNEEHGHLAGDRVLVEVARRIEESLRSNDTAARMGGDEFVALLEGVGSEEEARHVVRRMAVAFQAPVRLDEGSVRVSASFGIALGSPIYRRPQEWLREADSALFEAKREGKARGAIRGEKLSPGSLPELLISDDAKSPAPGSSDRGLDLDERIRIQPIVSLASGRMSAIRLRIDPLDGERGQLPLIWQRVAARYETWVRLGWLSPKTQVIVSTFDTGNEGWNDLPPELQEMFLLERPYEPGHLPGWGDPESGPGEAVSGFQLGYEAMRALVRARPKLVLLDVKSLLDCMDEDWKLLDIFVHLADDLGAMVVADGLQTVAERELTRRTGVGLAAGPLVASWMSLELFSAWLRPGMAA